MKGSREPAESRGIKFIGCCGAYCRTCRNLALGHCKGCKVGYEDGQRSMERAKCRIKICCFGTRELETCAECSELDHCRVLAKFHGKNAPEYGRYRESLEFICENGYAEFAKRAKAWRRGYGEF